MRKLYFRIKTSEFIRNVLVVSGGATAAHIITMAFVPVITRLYGPELFGLMGLFVSIVSLTAALAALGYPTAIVLPKSDSNALKLVKLSVLIGVGVALFVTFIIGFLGDKIFSLLQAEKISAFGYLIPIALFTILLHDVLTQWLTRKKSFVIIARFSIYTSVITNSIKVLMGFFSPSALALITANPIGKAMGTILAYTNYKNHGQPRHQSHESNSSLLEIAYTYRDFPLLRTPQNLINAFSQNLPILLLSSYFGSSSAGQYTLAISLLGVPTALIGNSVMSVFYPKITQAVHDGLAASQIIFKATISMAAIGILPFTAVIIFGPELFVFAFGSDWHMAGVYSQWLSVWIFFQYINKPAVAAIPALGLQRGLLIYEVFSTSTKLIALWIGLSYYGSDLTSIALFSIVGSIAYIWLIGWVIIKSNAIYKSNLIARETNGNI